MEYLNWRGIVQIEADTVALRDEEGAPHDIRDLFVETDDVAKVREVLTDIGGGLRSNSLTWDEEDGTQPSDKKVPGLASLLRYLAETTAPVKNIYATSIHKERIVHEESVIFEKRVRQVSPKVFQLAEAPPPFTLSRKGDRGKPGRSAYAESVVLSAVTKKSESFATPRAFSFLAEAPIFFAKSSRNVGGAKARVAVSSEFAIAERVSNKILTHSPKAFQIANSTTGRRRAASPPAPFFVRFCTTARAPPHRVLERTIP
jgi:hypothetical protein